MCVGKTECRVRPKRWQKADNRTECKMTSKIAAFLRYRLRWRIFFERSQFMKRIGVVGIVLRGDKAVAVEMQKVLSDFADIIIGRMGVPREEANAIALIVEGTQERISALTGKLGRFESLHIKSAITSFEV